MHKESLILHKCVFGKFIGGKIMKLKKLTALAMTTAMCAATVFGCGSSD